MKSAAHGNLVTAALCFACGALPFGVGLGLIPVEPGALQAPRALIIVVGVLFWLCGVALLLGGGRPRLNHLLGAAVLGCFALVGGWIAFEGPGGALSGGMPWLSDSTNERTARAVFGAGAALSALLCVYALRKAARGS